MPLLGGRHKSSQTGNQSAAPATAPERSAGQQQVCDSPLFGIRKQLPINVIANAIPQANVRGGSSPSRHMLPATATVFTNDISSVPHQISRLQIHYAFTIMDTNADGMLDVRDLSRTLANLGVPIDESILSHLMSRVSKRGDQRISEDEFLSWIADFIQVNDSTAGSGSGSHRQVRQPQQPSSSSSATQDNTLLGAGPSPGQVDVLRNGRRGSGSGLALMRALTSSKQQHTSSTSPPSSSPPSSPTSASKSGSSGGAADWQLAAAEASRNLAEAEARKDLRAAFCVFDLDGDGFITLEEVSSGLRLLGETWTPLEVRQMFSQCQSPARRSGERISIEDFIQMLL